MTYTPMMFVTTPQESMMDDDCGMKLWYMKYHAGTGLTPKKGLLTRELLLATQADMRTISVMADISQEAIQAMIDEILQKLTPEDRKDTRAMELLYRRLGWAAAYALFIEPQIRKLYLTVAIDEEVDLDRDPLWIRVRTGRVLRSRASQQLEHREFVPTASPSTKWRESWEFRLEPHIALEAVRGALKRDVRWARVTGLALGFVPSSPNSALHHPYVYGWRHKNTGEWTSHYMSPSATDWEERPVWDYPNSLTDWVMACGANTAEAQFPLSPQIPLNSAMLESWVIRRGQREALLHSVKTICQGNIGLRSRHFPQRTRLCAPVHSEPCAYKDLCWSEPFMADALALTDFIPTSKKRFEHPPVHLVSKETALVRLSDLVTQALADAQQDHADNIINGEVVLPAEPSEVTELSPGFVV